MKNLSFKTVLLVALLFVSIFSSAQNQNGTLMVQDKTFGYHYMIDGRGATSQEFMERLSIHPAATKMFKSGKGMSTTGNIIGSIGAFGVGFDLGTRLGGGDGNTGLLLGSGAVMAGGLVLYFVGRSKMNKSLKLYHNDRTSSHLNLKLSEEGVGLCLNF